MPRYDYRFDVCLNNFELKRAVSDRNNPSTCPACSGDAHKIIGELPSINIHWMNPMASEAITPPQHLPRVYNPILNEEDQNDR